MKKVISGILHKLYYKEGNFYIEIRNGMDISNYEFPESEVPEVLLNTAAGKIVTFEL